MVLMCFFIYFFAPNIIKKEIGYKKKSNKNIQTHTKAYILFPRPHQLLFFERQHAASSLSARGQRRDKRGKEKEKALANQQFEGERRNVITMKGAT